MKNFLIIITVLLLTNLTAQAQNLFLIGEKSYSCTNAIKLESNSVLLPNLDVFFAKNGETGVIGVGRSSMSDEVFAGKLVIYLKDGNVIVCNSIGASERVDIRANAVFTLTSDQLDKLKASNIHTVKYTMTGYNGQDYSASNKGIETSALIREFFKD